MAVVDLWSIFVIFSSMEINIWSPQRSTMSTSNLFSFILLHVLLFSKPIQRCNASSNCLEQGSWITNDISTNSTILSSPGNVFELGFFTPGGGSGKNWYLGIWYGTDTSMKTVVWVANRDNPLHESDASLIVQESNVLLKKTGTIYWSSDPNSTSPNSVRHYSNISSKSILSEHGGNSTQHLPRFNSTKLCLGDDGDLTLEPRGPLMPRWRSFDQPTDTFLPGMVANGNVLRSWQSQHSPAAGDFILQLDQELTDLIIINNKIGVPDWENTEPLENQIQKKLIGLLNGEKTAHILTRLVMNFTGHVQLWERDNSAGWSLKWFEPKDGCSLYNVCGYFGICNSYNRLLCKCLPGFTPVDPPNWDFGDHSSGCMSKSQSCGRKPDVDDMFLTLPMMNVGLWNFENSAVDCMTECLGDCDCIAYSSDNANLTGTGTEGSCKLWKSTKLTGLQEEYAGGLTLHVRTTHSAVALTSRDCNPCGTYSIPYPLSTASNCGDPSYFHFHCNTATGQVVFSTSIGKFIVTVITQETETFSIQVGNDNSCDGKTVESMVMLNMSSSPFHVRNCTVVSNQPSMDIDQPLIELEIGWQSPLEPACTSSSDCRDWPHTTCKTAKSGKKRCLCASNFDWDGLNLKCKKVASVKVLIACVAAALAIVLFGGMVFIYRKRRTARETGSVELMGDNSEPIDLPFFAWESILSATNKFADENKLGTGGFGSVYKGSLPDGQEIAVKRLSSVSVQGAEEFRTEVVLIAKLQHRNLVRLLGYCVKADEKILVYEYMPNGSLDACLFDETLSGNLDWEKRFDIISGIARGLLYLHQDSRLRIIHRDLKPSNVLLDDDLNPKISDFGIARIVEGKQTESNTKRVVGTYGYMSPEYAYEGIFSIKSDVFSFGVVVLETISGRRNSRIFIYEHGLSLLGHAWKLWSEDRGMELPELTLRKSCNISEVLKCIQIALLCVQEDPNDRPTMSTVVLMLSSENASLPSPKQPAFGTRKPPLEATSSSSAVDLSLNDVSLTVSTLGR
ncbi:G-type lectin S-receptor-like serine/threonine-protein kinase At4g03230 [Silene latifolia]|uniref:G-type lectin S-receptor-like serine/threonine-protein kinase At4g03230 n=1 Tax=Silene latifolia TaxID=37657 RepID=UPI003D788D06